MRICDAVARVLVIERLVSRMARGPARDAVRAERRDLIAALMATPAELVLPAGCRTEALDRKPDGAGADAPAAS